MDSFYLNLSTNNIGGYFSSEQIDLLSIIQCQTYEEIIDFVYKCKQLNGLFSKNDFQNFITQDLEQVKHYIFNIYQYTLVPHNSNNQTALDNTLSHLDITEEDRAFIKKEYENKTTETIKNINKYIKNKYPKNYEKIFEQAHRFISVERDQNKNPNLYDELVFLNKNLNKFNTLLIGSGKPEIVINNLFEEGNEKQFDFYFATRELDFALRNNKHIRFHSLLTKGAAESLFVGKSKEEILKTLTNYVKATIDFINEYNSTHTLEDKTPVINSIDLFNEIISFDKNNQGEYENIWETKYGISIEEICNIFKYAKEHKPKGVSYIYNEPFLEDTTRRKKVIETLYSINSISNGLIDTLGSQMHITFGTSDKQIQDCFNDFKKLQDTHNINIQITEFDLSLSEKETLKTINNTSQFSYDQIYSMKKEKINNISSIINNSNVNLSGISYWSLTDNIDCNLERVRTNLLKKGIINNINQVPTVCGGLIPTYNYSNIINNENNKIHK